ncbi:MAG: DEAD/DEAH box helicase [Actinomycetaceae bacterium]|nr:DEAD/DEAH box helicase [Actinomycetaceae bacterium]
MSIDPVGDLVFEDDIPEGVNPAVVEDNGNVIDRNDGDDETLLDEQDDNADLDDTDTDPESEDSADDGAPEDSDSGLTFADLDLPDVLLSAVTEMGFVTPTPIQAEAIPALLERRDVVGIAQTGTGKTAAFGLPLLTIVDPAEFHVQALVLAPTRELAMQSAVAIENFAAHTQDLVVVPVYGGSAYGPQIGALKRGAQVVVGTPGRIIDLIEKGALDLTQVRMLVLDEADEMLRMGFAEDVETITETVPDERLTALFSATMPATIERIAATHMTNPLRIAVSDESSTVDTIHQTYAVVPYKHKIGALSRVLATRAQHSASERADAAIVFVRTRVDVEEISLELAGRGFRAAGISGDVAQTERERMVERLKNGSLDVLVATDVAARGLDVERIGLVVNFDVPREPEAYVHRIGRTGRAGREGRSLTFFTPREYSRLRRIERLTGTPMEEVQIPSPAHVSEFRARRILDNVGSRIERGRLDLYLTLLDEIHDTTDLEASDIAAALLAQAVGDEGPALRILKDRRGEGRIRHEEELDESGEFVAATFEGGRDKDRPLKGGRDGSRRRGGGRAVGGSGRRYRIEVGKKDRVMPGAIVGAITGEGGIAGTDIGHIEIFPTFSLVEISGDIAPDAMTRIAKARVQGRALRIREDEGPGGGRDRSFNDRDDFGDRGGKERRGGFDRSDRRGERGDRRDYGDRRERGGRHHHEGGVDRRDRASFDRRSGDRHGHSGRSERRFGRPRS